MPKKHMQVGTATQLLDARPDRLDLRDLPYRPALRALPRAYPSEVHVEQFLGGYVRGGFILNQGQEGACTGFGLAAVVNYLLWNPKAPAGQTTVSAHMLYHLARFYDEWPGEGYEGSSCRGALKGWHKHGVCASDLWTSTPSANSAPNPKWTTDAVTRPLGIYYRVDKSSVVDLQAAILDTGAIYVSANVHKGWNLGDAKIVPARHADLPEIKLSTTYTGGHAFALVGFNDRGFIVQNSWGTEWGASGFAVLTYSDWVENGLDAWAVALGVPQASHADLPPLASARYFVQRAGNQTPATSGLFGGGNDDALGKRKVPTWTLEQAYSHALVTGNDGCVINRLPDAGDAAHTSQVICFREPKAWFEAHATAPGAPWRVAIYAHGGLNSEPDAITRTRIMGPTFEANGIYPIFVVWKSGPFETISDMLSDQFKSLFGISAPARGWTDRITDATDRTLEKVCHELLVRAMWTQMKDNVGESMADRRGLDQLVTQLDALRLLGQASGHPLEVHLIGHSAGSFIAGRTLRRWAQTGTGRTLNSCTLMAPACDVTFAINHYGTTLAEGGLPRARFQVHTLSNLRELDDSVGPYRKSLLYLVSRALEREHKTGILGLANAFDSDSVKDDSVWHGSQVEPVRLWQDMFWGKDSAPNKISTSNPAQGLFIVDKNSIDAGPRNIPAAHGAFDNSVFAMNTALENILGVKPSQPFTDLYY
jgi:hypothetical protein